MKKYFNVSIFICIVFLFSQSYAQEYRPMQVDEDSLNLINDLIDTYGKHKVLYQIIGDDNNTLHVNIKNKLRPSPYPLSRTNKKYIDAYSIYYDAKQNNISIYTLSKLLEEQYPEALEQKRLRQEQEKNEKIKQQQEEERLEQLRQETNQLLKTIKKTAYDYASRNDEIKLVKQYLSKGSYEEAYNKANDIINKQDTLREYERKEKERQVELEIKRLEEERLAKERQAELEIERLEQERLEKERQYKVRDEVLQLLITIDNEAYDYPSRNNDIELVKQYLSNNEYDNAINVAQMIYSNQINLKTQERLEQERQAKLELERLEQERQAKLELERLERVKKAGQVKLEIERSEKASQAKLEIERKILLKQTIYQCLISLALIIIILLRNKIINFFKKLLLKIWEKIIFLLNLIIIIIINVLNYFFSIILYLLDICLAIIDVLFECFKFFYNKLLLYRNETCLSYINSLLRYIYVVLSGSTNYFERVFVFLGLTQLLYFLFFIVVSIFEKLDLFDAIPVITWLSFGIGIILLVLFFFKQITVKDSLLFITGFVYLIALILFITIFMPDIYKTDRLWHFVSIIVYILSILKVSEVHTWYYEPTLPFMSGLLVWNILYSILILIIATGRSFLLWFFDGVRR